MSTTASTPASTDHEHEVGALILSHGRPASIARTIKALRKARYSGPWWIVLDDGDTTRAEYEERWGAERVVTFNKAAVAETFDLGDNAGDGPVVVYARNAADRIAAALGLRYHFVLDDDYNYFAHRFTREDGVFGYAYIYRLDDVLAALIDFLDLSGARTVAFAQGGDYIGGAAGVAFRRGLLRKAMNTFLVRTGQPPTFLGRLNEDCTTYVHAGSRGGLFFTTTDISIEQPNTQEQQGGLTDAYLDLGTYVKSFYSVMFTPSAVRIDTLGETGHRVHHAIRWNAAVPKIVSGSYRKA